MGTAGTSIAGMLCEGRFALYLAGEPYKSGLKPRLRQAEKAVFTMELDPDEEDETEPNNPESTNSTQRRLRGSFFV